MANHSRKCQIRDVQKKVSREILIRDPYSVLMDGLSDLVPCIQLELITGVSSVHDSVQHRACAALTKSPHGEQCFP